MSRPGCIVDEQVPTLSRSWSRSGGGGERRRSTAHGREDHQASPLAHPRRPAAGHAAGRPGPDHRLDGPPHHRGRPARGVAPGLGGHGVPVGVDGVDAAVGEAGRPVRAQDLLPGLDRHLRHRLGAGRVQPHHDRADRLPCPAGPGRRRPHGGCPDDHRRRGVAARPWPLHGPVRRHVRRGHGDRAADRWPVRHLPVVALGLLHQPAAGDPGPVRDGRRAARPPAPGQPQNRLRRCTAARRLGDGPHPLRQPGRDLVGVGVAPEHHLRRRGGPARDRVPLRGEGGGRARASRSSSTGCGCSTRRAPSAS